MFLSLHGGILNECGKIQRSGIVCGCVCMCVFFVYRDWTFSGLLE